MEKSCTKCRVTKPLTDFNKKKVAPDGVRSECRECQKGYFKKFSEENEEYMRERDKERYWKDKEANLSRNVEWRERVGYNEVRRGNRVENIEHERAREREWRAKNVDRLRMKNREAKRKNRAYHTRKQVEREANRLKATPKWADDRYIQMFYDMAKEAEALTGQKYHVDHIVPLRSDIVCGLHCEDNLQILPAAENIRKSNRIWPDMP